MEKIWDKLENGESLTDLEREMAWDDLLNSPVSTTEQQETDINSNVVYNSTNEHMKLTAKWFTTDMIVKVKDIAKHYGVTQKQVNEIIQSLGFETWEGSGEYCRQFRSHATCQLKELLYIHAKLIKCTQNETIHAQTTTKDIEVQETLETAKELDITPSDAPQSDVSSSTIEVTFTHLIYGDEVQEAKELPYLETNVEIGWQLEHMGYDVISIVSVKHSS